MSSVAVVPFPNVGMAVGLGYPVTAWNHFAFGQELEVFRQRVEAAEERAQVAEELGKWKFKDELEAWRRRAEAAEQRAEAAEAAEQTVNDELEALRTHLKAAEDRAEVAEEVGKWKVKDELEAFRKRAEAAEERAEVLEEAGKWKVRRAEAAEERAEVAQQTVKDELEAFHKRAEAAEDRAEVAEQIVNNELESLHNRVKAAEERAKVAEEVSKWKVRDELEAWRRRALAAEERAKVAEKTVKDELGVLRTRAEVAEGRAKVAEEVGKRKVRDELEAFRKRAEADEERAEVAEKTVKDELGVLRTRAEVVEERAKASEEHVKAMRMRAEVAEEFIKVADIRAQDAEEELGMWKSECLQIYDHYLLLYDSVVSYFHNQNVELASQCAEFDGWRLQMAGVVRDFFDQIHKSNASEEPSALKATFVLEEAKSAPAEPLSLPVLQTPMDPGTPRVSEEFDGENGLKVYKSSTATTHDGEQSHCERPIVETMRAEWKIRNFSTRLRQAMGRPLVSLPFCLWGLEEIRLIVTPMSPEIGIGPRSRYEKEQFSKMVTEGPLYATLMLKVPNAPHQCLLKYHLGVGKQQTGPYECDFSIAAVLNQDRSSLSVDWLSQMDEDSSITVSVEMLPPSLDRVGDGVVHECLQAVEDEEALPLPHDGPVLPPGLSP